MNWVTRTPPGDRMNVYGVVFTSSVNGWAAGTGDDEERLWETTNGGWDWSVVSGDMEYGGVLTSVTTRGDMVWVTTLNGCIKKYDSQNGWSSYECPANPIGPVTFVSDERAYCPADGTDLLVSTDGGNTWLLQNKPLFYGDASANECMPEVHLGRLPTRPGRGEEQVVIDKLQRYQDCPDTTDTSFLKRVHFYVGGWADMGDVPIGDRDGDLHKSEAIQQTPWYQAAGLSTYELYEPVSGSGTHGSWEGNDHFSQTNTISALSMGAHFVSEFWHAGFREWVCPADGVNFSFSHMPQVQNYGSEGLVFTHGCTGFYLLDDDALGRHFLISPTGGAVAFGGTSVANTFGDTPLCHRLLEIVYQPGPLTTLGLAHDGAVFYKRGTGRDRIVENLLGDPTMDVWTDVPGSLNVAWDPPSLWLEPTEFTVTVTDASAMPVAYATVCLSLKDPSSGVYVLYHVKSTTGAGTATFSLDPKQTGEMVVSVMKHNYLPYHGACHIGLYTDNPDATANSQQRNIARVAGSSTLHIVYTSGENVMHSVSWDGGQCWSLPDVVGAGDHPALTLNYGSGQVRDVPWVIYHHSGDIKLAVLHDGQPVQTKTLFQGSAPDSFAMPAAIAAEPLLSLIDPSAWATFEVVRNAGVSSIYRIYAGRVWEHSAGLAWSVLDQQIGSVSECSQPSIAITPGTSVHVAWQRLNNTAGSSIYYSEFRTSWTPPFPVSQLGLGAYNPFVETYGDSVWCAWESPATSPDIYRRGRYLPDQHWMWNPQFVNVSQSPVASARPVMVGRDICAWQEGGNNPGEVLLEVDGEIVNLSNSPTVNSAYPSIEFRTYGVPPVARTTVYAVWTEGVPNQSCYEVKFTSSDRLPTDGPGKSLSTYYAVATGDSLASPYCRHRTGAVSLGSYSLDYGLDSLSYTLPYLDPQYDYYVRAVLYQQGQRDWRECVRVDDSLSLVVPFQPRKPESLWVQIPPGCYRRDAVAPAHISRLAGEYGVLTDFSVERWEPARSAPQGGEGGQIAAIVPLRLEFRPAAPNPFRRSVQLRFGLNRAGHVSLRVFDVSGRMVREFTAGELPAGYHCVAWDGHDAAGRRLAAGTYFVRLSAEKQSSVQKVVFSR